MPVSQFSHLSSARSPYQEPFFYKERLIHFFKGTLVLPHCSSYGIGPDRAALEFGYDSPQYLVVYRIEPAFVDIQCIKSISGYLDVYMAVTYDLGEITNPAEKRICDTWSSAASESHFVRSLIIDGNPQNRCTSMDYMHKIGRIIVFQGELDAETRPQRRREQAASGRSADLGVRFQCNPYGPGTWPLVYHYVYDKIFHCGIQIFFHNR